MAMRTLSIALLGLAMQSGAWAQEAAAPSGTFFRPQEWNPGSSLRFNGKPEAPPPAAMPTPAAITRCAVPLLQMRAPSEAGDAAIQFVPRSDAVDPMPSAKLPPACDAAPPQ